MVNKGCKGLLRGVDRNNRSALVKINVLGFDVALIVEPTFQRAGMWFSYI